MNYRGVDPDKFWARVDTSGDCWEWTGARGDDGYGRCYIPQGQTTGAAHRVAYSLLVGPLSRATQLDHLCRNRACVNPGHLEPVTAQENVLRSESPAARNARRATCAEGHPLTVRYDGNRGCSICKTSRQRARRAEKRAINA